MLGGGAAAQAPAWSSVQLPSVKSSSRRKRTLVMVKSSAMSGERSPLTVAERAIAPFTRVMLKTTSLKSRSPPPLRSSNPRIQRKGSVDGAPTITCGMLSPVRNTSCRSCGITRLPYADVASRVSVPLSSQP